MEEFKVTMLVIGLTLLAVHIDRIIKNIKPMKKSLKISEELALELYPTADEAFKKVLEENFGIDFFKPKEITDIVFDETSLAKYLGIKEDDLFVYDKNTNDPFEMYMNACAILPKVGAIYNQGTKLDWKDINILKWAPYWDGQDGSVGFHGWVFSLSYPAGFYLKDRKLAEKSYANFEKHWKAFWFYEE